MDLIELKALMEIDFEDTSNDTTLQLKLDSALELIEIWFNKYADKKHIKYDSYGNFIVPAGAKVAIQKYIEASDISAGVRSESIGGMSQTFGGGSNSNSNNSPLDDFEAYLNLYRPGISFIPVRKRK